MRLPKARLFNSIHDTKRNFLQIPLFFGVRPLNGVKVMDILNLLATLRLPDGKSAPQIGGQAVIEGVMMRSPERVAVAVRKPGPDGGIVLKQDPVRSWTKRIKALGLPFIRGGVILIESMVLGVKALNFSSEIAMMEEEKATGKPKDKKPSSWMLGITVVFAFALGLALFFYLPLKLTEWMGIRNGLAFNLVDGGLRLSIFLAYLGLISLWKDIRRIFEYHGAEHKSIFAYENGRPLTLEGVKPFTTFHPRCGTSFLLVVMLVSLGVFMGLGRPDTVPERLVRFLFIPVIGGISYEIIKWSATKTGRIFAGILVAPGLWLQRITTKEPDNGQIEVALTALISALGLPAAGPPEDSRKMSDRGQPAIEIITGH